ncbi:AIM24 family protein [Schaalia sp. Marseille-Q2122]|uniref:AIM24 family protein n=1 Tax=Schaalia sp. Marseille-Q2122 TaxID=2736604 RepID=UPI00158BF6D1|nr:AIM24 family protein [Schaalia sp. Marseille-Q2122]
MAFLVRNLIDNDDITLVQSLGAFDIIEYNRDLSVDLSSAQTAYFAGKMNVRRRQAIAKLNNSAVTLQAGAMQWMVGNVSLTSGVKGAGDMLGKMLRSTVTGESAVKPEYSGSGLVALEPTYKHLLAVDLADWNGNLVVEDGMFLACESTVQQKLVHRSSMSSAFAGGEGFFNLALAGQGVVLLESFVPRAELIEVELQDDVLKVDGSLAVAWSGSLNFTVERSSKSLMGSMASGEGLVNVYSGTGRVLMSPVASTSPLLNAVSRA